MNEDPILKDAAAVNALAHRLMHCPEVTRYNEGEHNEAGAIANNFRDLEGSFRKFLEDQLPKLTKGQLDPSETYDLLFDIGEEFRHILYHIITSKYYQYLPHDPDYYLH
jgi:hypothetical protein